MSLLKRLRIVHALILIAGFLVVNIGLTIYRRQDTANVSTSNSTTTTIGFVEVGGMPTTTGVEQTEESTTTTTETQGVQTVPTVGGSTTTTVPETSPATTDTTISTGVQVTTASTTPAASNQVTTVVEQPVTTLRQEPPGKPDALSVATANGQVTLSWKQPKTIGTSPIGAYIVAYATSRNGPWKTAYTGTNMTAKVVGLANGTSYEFRVTATNSAGSSNPATISGTPFTVPGAVINLTAEPKDQGLGITWSAPASNGGATVSGYEVSWSADGKTWTKLKPITGTSAQVTGLTNGSKYQVKVLAENAAGSSAPSTVQATAYTTPDAPTAVAVSSGKGSMTVTWTAPLSDGGLDISDYQVTWSIDGANWNGWAHTPSTATTATLSGLSNGTTYQVRVAAVTQAGVGNPGTGSGTPFTVPGAPTSMAVKAQVKSVAVTWKAPASNGGSAVLGYIIQYSTTTTWKTYKTVGPTTLAVTVTGLTAKTSYNVRVIAFNAAGNGTAVTKTAKPT